MKLLRYGESGREKPGLLDSQGKIRDLSGVVNDIAGDALSADGLEKLRGLDPASLPEVQGTPRLGPPVGHVGKFICVGLNYADHAAESGMAVPEQPVIFMKATTEICGPFDQVIIPRGSEKTDWEVELGVIIGDVARDVPVETAMQHVAGYTVINDISERFFQLEQGGAVGEGQELRHLRPYRPVAGDARRSAGAAEPRHALVRQRSPVPERQHQDDGVRRGNAGELYQPLYDVDAWRHHQHRHTAWCRPGPEAAGVPETWRCHGTGNRRAGPSATRSDFS